MSEPSPPRHSTRETRLLLLTLAVSVAALLLLARFRFPERPLTDLSTPQPLTRLTRVTAFDELSAMLRDLLRQFEGAVVLARVTPAGNAGTAAGNGMAGGAGSSVNGGAAGGGAAHGGGTPGGNGSAGARGVEAPRDTLGLLVRDDLALVPLAPGGRVDAIAGSPLAANGIVARDEQRGLAVVRVPGYSAAEISVQPPATPLDAPGYVAILEAAPDGPTIRAEFVSRYSTEPHAGWDQPVLALSGPPTAKPGSLLFTLSGRFVGMTLADSGRLLVVPADALMSRATRLANGESIAVVASGLDVQPMTPSIARATGAREGVVVSHVSAAAVSNVIAATGGSAGPMGAGTVGAGTSAAAGTGAGTEAGAAGSASAGGGTEIAIGDVITMAAGRPVRAPRDWQQILREQASAATIKLSILRFGKTLQGSLTLPRAAGSTGGSTGGSTSSSAGAGASGGAGAAGASSSGAPGVTAGAVASPQSALDVMGLSLRSVAGGSELTAVRPASPAARAGLRAGDRITSLPGRATSAAATSPNAIATACAELASGQALLLAIDRDGTARIAAVEKP